MLPVPLQFVINYRPLVLVSQNDEQHQHPDILQEAGEACLLCNDRLAPGG